jgi:hypothetical protein
MGVGENSMASTKMSEAVKAYDAAVGELRAVERANAGMEDLRPVNAKKGDLDRAEEAMVLQMIAEASKEDPTKSDDLYFAFNRSRNSAVYWPKLVSTALKYARGA